MLKNLHGLASPSQMIQPEAEGRRRAGPIPQADLGVRGQGPRPRCQQTAIYAELQRDMQKT
jgi:hypothetical protein